MKATKKRPPIIACQDDKAIIKRMKEVGVWSKMKECIQMGGPVAIIEGDELLMAAMATNALPATPCQIRH